MSLLEISRKTILNLPIKIECKPKNPTHQSKSVSHPMIRGIARILGKGVLDYAREAHEQKFKPCPLIN